MQQDRSKDGAGNRINRIPVIPHTRARIRVRPSYGQDVTGCNTSSEINSLQGPSPCHPAAGDADRDSNRFAEFLRDGF